MNILLWTFQIILALHTATGAIWKFSNSAEQTMPSLKVIPDVAWQTMAILELLFGLALILPAFYEPLAVLVPVVACLIAMEMILFTGIHFSAGDKSYGPVVYWLVVAVICVFIAYGRFS